MSTSPPPSNTSGPYPGESKADAWLFEHSKFLRKHFSPKGPTDLPSKHELVQERSSGDGAAFPKESRMDAALFEHSKFLRKHIKHEGDYDEIKSKHAMLRESFDGDRPRGAGGMRDENGNIILRKTMRGEPAPAVQPQQETYDPPQDDAVPVLAAPVDTATQVPAWQAATDTSVPYGSEVSPQRSATGADTSADPVLISQTATVDPARAYGDEASLRSAAAAGMRNRSKDVGPGLIEHHPTTMESTPVVERPVPHSLMSNAKFGGGTGAGEEQDPMAR
jgi:hypothetical protein